MPDALPPGWTPPKPKDPHDAFAVCDRCGALVAEWNPHYEWHLNLAETVALITGSLTAMSTPPSGYTDEMRDFVAWAQGRVSA